MYARPTEGMIPTTSFFDQPQPAAVLKLGILSRYLPPFAFKTGSAAPGGRVAYIDGYAGRGKYRDGSPGSPAVAVALAETMAKAKAAKGGDRIDGYFVEKDPAAARALGEYFDSEGNTWPVYEGDVQDYLVDITDDIDDNTPLFAFLDPFGLNLPMHMIVKHLLSRSGKIGRGGYRETGAATEVLLNFSLHGVRRAAGHLVSPKKYKAKGAFVDRVDEMLGGDWWHEIWASEDPDRNDLIRQGYTQRFLELPGDWGVYEVDVRDRLDGPIEYWLLFLTQHPDGVWQFNESVSLSMEEHRNECRAWSGELDLDPLDVREERWVDEIADNVRSILDDTGTFVLGNEVSRVYGATLGHAREKHVRRAVKQLHAVGRTPTSGTTSGGTRLQKLRVVHLPERRR